MWVGEIGALKTSVKRGKNLKTAIFFNKVVCTHNYRKFILVGLDWIYLPQVMDKWRAFVNTVMKQNGVPLNSVNFLTSYRTTSFSKKVSVP
jgi:hypothetical protein